MPAPDDEQLLAHHLARCFRQLQDWLGGQRPTGSDVLGVLEALTRRERSGAVDDQTTREERIRMTTPEARYDVSVQLSGGLLLAAFADVDHAIGRPDETHWGETYRTLERLLGDDFHRLRRSHGIPDLRGEAHRFVRAFLLSEGLE